MTLDNIAQGHSQLRRRTQKKTGFIEGSGWLGERSKSKRLLDCDEGEDMGAWLPTGLDPADDSIFPVYEFSSYLSVVDEVIYHLYQAGHRNFMFD